MPNVSMTLAPLTRLLALLCLAALCAVSLPVAAIEDLDLELENAAGEGWRAQGVSVAVNLTPKGLSLSARAQHVEMAAVGTVRDVRIHCAVAEVTAAQIACGDAQIHARLPGLGAQSLRGTLRYGRRDGALAVELRGLKLDAGSGEVSLALAHGRWHATATARGLPLAPLLKLARDLDVLPQAAAAITATGVVSLQLDVVGAGSDLKTAQLAAQVSELTANNPEGTLATDRLTAQLQTSLRRVGTDWHVTVDSRFTHGQGYAEPIFVDFGSHAAGAQLVGRQQADGQWFIDRFEVEHADVLQAHGSATLDPRLAQPVRELDLQVAKLQFPGAYATYLQPLLINGAFGSVQSSGALSGRIRVRDGMPASADIDLQDVSFDDGRGSFALAALSGAMHWNSDEQLIREGRADSDSQLTWRSGAVLGMALGASSIRFRAAGRQFRLLEPTSIQLLDGAINLESLRIRNAGLPNMAFLIDAVVEPISMPRLCRAFGWPEFGGSVGGAVSKLRMSDGVVTLGAELQAQVFDGQVTVRNLRLEQPFGTWPRLSAAVAINALDLELVTSAFSFGRITGRLSGAVDGLQLFNWMPVAFDARLFTPRDDRSRHRISQRAVENIGSIGGGGSSVTAALSSGFLRFFEDFNYDRLGISCRLANDVCVMDGVAPAANGGYYLVKGKGLPRIDVIGSSKRVDWPRLVQQLIAITESEGPIVE